MRTKRMLVVGALALTVVAAPAAEAKKRKLRSSATYMTTVKASMTEAWSFRDYWSYDCLDGMCTREQKGSGTAAANLRTSRPFPLMVIRGPKGRPPILNLGSDGIPMTGSWLRGGDMSTEYSGAWDAGNPDRYEETTGCGPVDVETFASIGWSYEKPMHLQLIMEGEPLREDCPDGPSSGLEWENDASPMLQDVLASVGKQKFLGTKQFTVRGTSSWKGTVTPTNRTDPADTKIVNGEKTVTWQWEATFRLKGAKKRKRR